MLYPTCGLDPKPKQPVNVFTQIRRRLSDRYSILVCIFWWSRMGSGHELLTYARTSQICSAVSISPNADYDAFPTAASWIPLCMIMKSWLIGVMPGVAASIERRRFQAMCLSNLKIRHSAQVRTVTGGAMARIHELPQSHL